MLKLSVHYYLRKMLMLALLGSSKAAFKVLYKPFLGKLRISYTYWSLLLNGVSILFHMDWPILMQLPYQN